MEKYELLPENQHSFRVKGSTMTAHTAMQNEWVRSTEEKKQASCCGTLFAAYDTLDAKLFCKKLRIYGGNEKTNKWFDSFLTDSTQGPKCKAQ